MYNKDEVDDSLEFCKEIDYYKRTDEQKKLNELSWQPIEIKDIEGISNKREYIKGIYNVILCLLFALAFSFLFTNYVALHTKVEGMSMEPTLENGDYLIVDRLGYRFQSPARFDIVIFPHSKGINYIKRVIGLPGEKVQIVEGNVYIDDKLLEDPYGSEDMQEAGVAANPVLLGDDEYFVLGDNRNNSNDSRKEQVGFIKGKDFIGKAWLKIYPFHSFGILKQ